MRTPQILLIPALFVLPLAIFGQPGAIPTPIAAPSDAYQVGYAANLDVADSVVNITNTGTLTLPTGLTTTGNMCINVYAFDTNQTMVACCSCLVRPNVINSLSVQNDISLFTLNRQRPTSMTIKLLATTPIGLSPTGAGGTCNPSSPTATPAGPGVFGSLVPGMRAWGTTVHKIPVFPGMAVTEANFQQSPLSPAELTRLTTSCSSLQAGNNGICNACSPGGL